MTEATQPWVGFKYEPVRGLTDRRISRYLRTQRKNMRRFFAERGLFDELEQMERIRKSRQGMMAKNQMFQEVLNAYAARTAPQPVSKTASMEGGAGSMALPSGTMERTSPSADSTGVDATQSVSEVAATGIGDGPMIEE